MGNKHAKLTPPSTSGSRGTTLSTVPASTTSDPSASDASANVAPSGTTHTALMPVHSLLETKLADVDVSAVFSQYEMLSIRKHLAAVLCQHENDAVVIPKDEFFRFLAGGDGSTSSLYVNRLYAIFDMEKKGHVRTQNKGCGSFLLLEECVV